MALNYRPPQLPQQQDQSGLVNSLDNLFNAYLRGKQQSQQFGTQQQIQGLQIANAQREQTLGQIQDTAQFGAPLASYAPSQIQQAGQPLPPSIQDDGLGHLRAGLEQIRASRKTKTETDAAGLRKELGQARLAEGQAGYFESIAGGGGKPTTQNIGGVDYLVTPGPKGPAYSPVPERRPAATESVARGFADKATLADQELTSVLSGGFNPGDASGVLAPYTPNIIKSSDRQRFEQAERQFVNAILRRESGAAIPPYELENYRKQYFPAAGDSQDVIQQKARARSLAIAGLAQEGSRVPSQIQSQQGAGAKAAPIALTGAKAARLAELRAKAKR